MNCVNGKIKVSIIIPAYNVCEYIYRAIESTLNQTYSNIEVIVVNDGSNDNTWEVINSYMVKDKRVIGVTQVNSGVSAARNRGLDIATGEYILFLDGDDWIEKDTVQILLTLALDYPSKLIMADCFFAYYTVDNNIVKYDQSEACKNTIFLNCDEILEYIAKLKYKLRSSCYKIYSYKIIQENHIRFNPKIFHGEDGLFVYEYLHRTDGAIYTPKALWNILERSNSATRIGYNRKWLTALEAVEHMMKIDEKFEVHNKQLKAYYSERALTIARTCICTAKDEEIEDFDYLRKKAKRFGREYIVSGRKIKEKMYYIFMMYTPICLLKKIYGKRCENNE